MRNRKVLFREAVGVCNRKRALGKEPRQSDRFQRSTETADSKGKEENGMYKAQSNREPDKYGNGTAVSTE